MSQCCQLHFQDKRHFQLQESLPVLHFAFVCRDRATCSSKRNLVEYTSGHYWTFGNTMLGTFHCSASFLPVCLLPVFKPLDKGQRPRPCAKPVIRTETLGEARQISSSSFCLGKLTRWFLKSVFVQPLDNQESREHHSLLFSYLLL